MPRGRKPLSASAKGKVATKRKNSMRQYVLNKICVDLVADEEQNNGRKQYGSVSKVVKEMKRDFPWITRDVVNYALKVHKKKTCAVVDSNSVVVDSNSVTSVGDDNSGLERKKGGRPVGTTSSNQLRKDVSYRFCLDDIAIEFDSEKRKASALGKYVPSGCLKRIIKKHKRKYGLGDDVVLKESTIRGRFYTKKLIVKSMGPLSPMADVEPALVALILKMSAIRRCLTPSQCLHLANDLVAGTETEKQVIEFKKKLYKKDYDSADLGMNYWNGFKRRWEHVISSKRGQKFALDRSSATTFANIGKMYDEVYAALEDTGIATKLDDPVYMDREYNVVSNQIEAFGTRCTHSLDHPDLCIVVDEVGSNLSQKGDGHIGGQKYVCAKGSIPQIKVQHSERHFTLLGFTALSGEPVLCLVIISGVREHFNVETGIDPTKPVTGDVNDHDFIERNFGKGKLFPGGPSCKYRGKDIPCMVRWSPKGGITSHILADALAHIDSFDVFDRSIGQIPFLLLDGHNSRFSLPFLEYITDDAHR